MKGRHPPLAQTPKDSKIRVAVIIQRYFPIFGGAENQCRLLNEYLAKTAKVAIPFVLTRRIRSDLPRSEKIDRISVIRRGLPGLGCWSGYSFYMFLLLHLLRQRRKYDIIHCHSTALVGFTAAVVGKILRKPVILKLSTNGELVTQRGNAAPKPGILRRCTLRFEHILARFNGRNAHIVALNEEGKSELETIRATSIHMIPNGIDSDAFSSPQPGERDLLKRAHGYSAEDIVILFTGRFVERKGIDLLLDAFAGLIEKSEDGILRRARLCLIGSDELQKESVRGKIEMTLEHYPNAIRTLHPGNSVVEYLKMADIFAFPSRREGMPNSVLEAFAVGLPCVLSNIAPHLELAIQNPCADVYFFISNNVSSLQETLEFVIRAAADSKIGRDGVSSEIDPKFQIDNVAQTYLTLYHTLMRQQITTNC